MTKRVDVGIVDGEIKFDFNGFEGDTCSTEEVLIRALLEKMGVKTHVIRSDNERETELESVAERTRTGQ